MRAFGASGTAVSSSFAEFLRSEKLDKPIASYYEITQGIHPPMQA